MQQLATQSNPLGVPAAEWQVRVDLAAAHRLAFMHGFNEGIFNHLTAVVPGKANRYYKIPFGLHWSEVSASSFMELDFEGVVLEGDGEPERSSICIHAPMHRLAPHAASWHRGVGTLGRVGSPARSPGAAWHLASSRAYGVQGYSAAYGG